MILVRNVFRLKFGKTKEAVALMKEGLAIQKRAGAPYTYRILTDLTGPFYTMVLELTCRIPRRSRQRRRDTWATRISRRTTRSSCR